MSGMVCTWIGAGVGSCLGVLLIFSNLLSLFRYFSTKGEDSASPGSMAAWGVSVAGLFLGPCGLFTSVIALILANLERRKVFRDEASPWSLLPCSMATTNAVVNVIIIVLMTVATAAGLLLPSE